MAVKKDGGKITAEKLDIINNPIEWIKQLEQFFSGEIEKAHCPVCNSSIEAKAYCGKDRKGFVVISCTACNKAAHFSRVEIPKEISVEEL